MPTTTKTTTRPYSVTIAVAEGHCPEPKTISLARYTTLASAISGAQRRASAIPDGTIMIRLHGEIVRSVYTHGRVAAWLP